jgi:hypothetical protein
VAHVAPQESRWPRIVRASANLAVNFGNRVSAGCRRLVHESYRFFHWKAGHR